MRGPWARGNLRRLSPQRIEQRLGLLQVKRVEALGEPVVDWGEKIVSLPRLALITPQARQAPRRAQLQRPCLLRAGHRKRALKMIFRLRDIRLGRHQFDVPCGSLDIGLAPSFFGGLRRRHGFINAAPRVIKLIEFRVSPRQVRPMRGQPQC